MRKAMALATALAVGVGFATVAFEAPVAAQENRRTYETRVSKKQRNPGESSPTCVGDAKRGEVTKGALYGAGAGALLGGAVGLGTVGGALVGAGAGVGVQHAQNNAACGR